MLLQKRPYGGHTLVLFTLLVIDIAWRVRFIHGGADAKALMWVTLLFPSWAEVPVLSTDSMNEIVLHLPPSLSLLIWGGFLFILIPFILLMRNMANGSIRSFSDLSMAWMALSIPLNSVHDRHVWILTDTMVLPNGETVVQNQGGLHVEHRAMKNCWNTLSELEEIGTE